MSLHREGISCVWVESALVITSNGSIGRFPGPRTESPITICFCPANIRRVPKGCDFKPCLRPAFYRLYAMSRSYAMSIIDIIEDSE
jgi:hypothetical protein